MKAIVEIPLDPDTPPSDYPAIVRELQESVTFWVKEASTMTWQNPDKAVTVRITEE